MEFNLPFKKNIAILALGAESAGNFSVCQNGFVYFSQDFGDLLENTNFNKYKTELREYLKNKNIKPDIILTDLHPNFLTTKLGKKLARKYRAKHIFIQHHIAHIFSAIGDRKLFQNSKFKIQNSVIGVALDGTGYGADRKIWGGEVFKIQKSKITRIGHLENQTMLGSELAIKEPARMLLSILNKVFSAPSSPLGRGCPPRRTGEGRSELQKKNFIYNFVKKYYTRNEFELLYNQLQQNFNCVETSSAGRILDAVSLLLGFCGNKRNYKHEPAFLLEANSSKPYTDLKPKIDIAKNNYTLNTTFLFEYLIKNLRKDKKRLAATAQLYIAQGLYELVCHSRAGGNPVRKPNVAKPYFFLSGGIADNKIISQYFKSKNFYINKKIPRSDAGISFGQIVWFLLNN